MKRTLLFVAVAVISVAVGSCLLFGNSYSPPFWLIGTWETTWTGGAFPNYDRWVITEDNLELTHVRSGVVTEVFDYSEYGYSEESDDFSYTLRSALIEGYYETFTRIVGDPNHVDYYSDSPFLVFPEDYTLNRIE